MFNFLKKALSKIYSHFASALSGLFGRATIDQATLDELELILISADTGVKTTRTIIEHLKKDVASGAIVQGSDLKNALEKQLITILQSKAQSQQADVYLLVGINGSGKTTFAGKLTHLLASQGKKVLLVAGDTFRAAAVEQLTQWAQRTGATIYAGTPGQDPASVIFAGCEQFKKEQFDSLIIDTAGRLQSKSNLMKELEKIKKVIARQLPNHRICTLLTIDSMLGQNSFEQAKLFHESTQVDGIVLTKMDGTAKGGIVFAITQELGIPVTYITYGEQLDQIKKFDAPEYVHELLS